MEKKETRARWGAKEIAGAAVAMTGMLMMTGKCQDETWFWLSKLIGAALFAAVIIPTIRKQEE